MEINRIKKLRIAMGLTQAQLAKKAGVSEKSIWNAENNKISPLIMNKIVKGFTKTTEIDEVLKTLSKVVKKEKIISHLNMRVTISLDQILMRKKV